MTYILSKDRIRNVEEAFKIYFDYLNSVKSKLPSSAYKLAIADWYYDPNIDRCPHDAWLEEVVISEPHRGKRNELRTVSIKIKLLSAYHNGYIKLLYPRVFNYKLNCPFVERGHRDWRYDEFRLSNNNWLVHEIEWSGNKNTAIWIIEADDVLFEWEPINHNGR